MGTLQYSQVRPAVAQSDLTTIAPYMFWLMFRNIASDGFVFEDPLNTGVLSQPGCVLASPSWENTATNVSQDYVYNWTRDAAIAAIELAAGPLPTPQPLTNYVQFAQTCQNEANAIGHFDRASFLINGTPRSWTDQTDGPALQTLALLQLYAQLDAQTQATASTVIAANLNFLAERVPGPDLQPVGGGVRRLVLRPLGPAAVLPGHHGQHRRHRRPGLADHRHPVAAERPGQPLERPVLPVHGAGPGRLPGSLRPEHRHRHGGHLRRHPGHRHQAPGHRRPAAQPVGRPGLDVLLPGQRRRSATRHRSPARPLPGGRVRRRHRRAGRRSPLGGLHGQLRRALLPARPKDHYWRNGPADSLSPASSARSGWTRRPRPPRPRRRCRPPATRCCRRSSSTATTSSSASSSTPPPDTRRASATCPGATPHSCPRSAPGPPSEMSSSVTHCATFSG